MAVYKVPQDVEADDKLIGPFSFRQFVYLLITAGAIAIAWGLYMLFPLLVIIPLPVIVFFGALALPLRKDQPMEIYLAAMVSFYLKPRKRLWTPDGLNSLIEITAPKTVEVQRFKNISQNEAQERFGYLANIVDSQGWAVRGVGVEAPNSPMNSDMYFEAQQAPDILDNSNSVSQSLDQMINQSDAKRHQEMVDRMKQPPTAAATPVVDPYATLAPTPAIIVTQPVNDPYSTFTPPAAIAAPEPTQPLAFNPYPTFQQSVIQPLSQQPQAPAQPATPVQQLVAAPTLVEPVNTSEKPVSAGIMNLVNNTDLSIETIAREANRIHEQEAEEEVVISLR